MNAFQWELLMGAGLLILGQGGILHLGLRKYINGMSDDVLEIKSDVKTLIAGQHQFDLRLTVIEQDVLHLKEDCSQCLNGVSPQLL